MNISEKDNSLLLLQIGPVQEFIAQARSTRDLWSGSFLVSWMAAHSVKWLRDRFPGEVDCVFPCVPKTTQSEEFPPTLLWLETPLRDRQPKDAPAALMPAIPNRVLAVVPSICDRDVIQEMIAEIFSEKPDSEWGRISERCWKFLNDNGGGPPCDKALWTQQVRAHWQTSWQLWPMNRLAEATSLMQQTELGRQALSKFASMDDWMSNYFVVAHHLDARRQTREFDAWIGEARRPKDAFSGKDEALIHFDPDSSSGCWLRDARQNSDKLRHLFRSNDALGAVSIIKRVWHRAYLEPVQGFDKPGPLGDTCFNVPSVPGIAAFPWVVEARKCLATSDSMLALQRAVRAIDRHVDTRLAKPEPNESPSQWMGRVDWQVYHENFWRAEARTAEQEGNEAHKQAAEDGLRALSAVIKEAKDADLGTPCSYYAVIAMDGDGMGKWLSGEKLRRPLTRDIHEKISLGLTRATIGQQRTFVDLVPDAPGARGVIEDPKKQGSDQEHPFQGKVIYAGADDVLAILPATQALDCAASMARVFREVMDATVQQGPEADRFAISAGIAIGHIKEPLQDLVETAFKELRRAKDEIGGNAVAVTLFKRSGEMIRWGASFASPAFPLLHHYQQHSRRTPGSPSKPIISGRFPHRLAEVLSCYPPGGGKQALTTELADIARAEFAFVAAKPVAAPGAERAELIELANAYLAEMQRWQPDPLNPKLRSPGIADFSNLFQIEAFIARQED